MRIAALLLLPLLASCSIYRALVPADRIAPGDKIKTQADAIRAGMNCGTEAEDPDHWQAHLHRDIWYVYWASGQNEIEAQVAKADGSILSCDVKDALAPDR